jgi:hypothetical protein
MNDSALIHPALMVTAQIYDHATRVRSFEILTDVHWDMAQAA